MKCEVLVSTINQTIELYTKMNIVSDAYIVNQCDTFDYQELEVNQSTVKFHSFNERGVGLSRNTALMRSNADICILADDDMIYVDDYENIILEEFRNNPKADMIVFDVNIHQNGKVKNRVQHNGRVRLHNCLRYGAVTFVFRRESIIKNNISFSLLFGGGAKYGSGEDSLFIWECIKKGLKVYSSTKLIANVYNDESTWFEGYNEKFFYDKGALYKAISPNFYIAFLLRFTFKNHFKVNKYGIDVIKAIRLMKQGAKAFSNTLKLST